MVVIVMGKNCLFFDSVLLLVAPGKDPACLCFMLISSASTVVR